jgi:uncharacterized protein YjbI with pentapeptide repeats
MTWVHRGFVLFDLAICGWFLLPSTGPVSLFGRVLVWALIPFALVTSFVFAAFPGELIYTKLEGHWLHAFTDKVFEGPSDPVDYIKKGGIVPFPNRLILPDNPKLADVAGAPSDGVSLSVRGRNFRKAVFDRSNLVRVDFSAADLEGASLRGARLEDAKFECAGSGSIETYRGPAGAFDSTYTPQGDHPVCTNLNGASLASANLDRASFEGAQLRGSALNGTSVTRANFSNSNLMGAKLTGAVGRETKFSGARLIAVNASYTRLFAGDFKRASLQGAILTSSYLEAANFRGSNMQGVDANFAFLQGASFEETWLHAATFMSANIQGVTFKGAALANASLICAAPFRNDFENADRDQAIVGKRCVTGWYDTGYGYTRNDPIDSAYRLPTDALPVAKDYSDLGYTDYSWAGTVPEFLHAENLDDTTFAVVLNRSTSNLLEDAKARVAQAFERLRPGGPVQGAGRRGEGILDGLGQKLATAREP